MKGKLLIALTLIAILCTVSSCASSQGGCKATKGYVGYGR